jgi:hypothetical protein
MKPLDETELRPWRSLVRVVRIGPGPDTLALRVPGWNPHKTVLISRSGLPAELAASVMSGQMFFARVNIGARFARHLSFTDWEVAPPPVSEEELLRHQTGGI